jgi:HSP20 family protein
MATETLPVKKTESIWDEMEKMHDRIVSRAYEIFDGNGQILGKDLDDWLQAERELLWEPSIELAEKDDEFLVRAAVPGMEAKDIQVEVTADDLLVKAETRHEHKEEKGKVYKCEFESGRLFRQIQFPKRIDPDKVKAEFKNGMLTITASIAKEQQTKKIAIAAA